MEKQQNQIVPSIKFIADEVPKNRKPNLDNVYGTDKFKSHLEDIINGIMGSHLYYIFGVKPPHSFLFHGPAGTGKTLAATAIANTLATVRQEKKTYFLHYDIGNMGTAYINMGAVNLQKFFDYGFLKAQQPETGTVIYWFDECESLMGHRQSGGHKEDDKLLNCLMKNLQNINDRGTCENVFFASNFIDGIDKASIRSGRISEKLEFKLPDYATRTKVIDGFITEKNNLARYQLVRKYDLHRLALLSEDLSHADITSAIDLSISNKIKRGLKTFKGGVIPAYYITHKGLEKAFNDIKKNNLPKKTIGFK